MRLLHTSDWHLGRTFHGASMHAEQEAMVDEIVAVTADSRIDAVVIAGDLFDRAIPPLDAVSLFEDAVARLRATGAQVVAIAGNHDSARRVSVHSGLLARVGVTIRGDATRSLAPVMIQPADGGAPVALYPVPYLDPASTAPAFGEPEDPSARRPTHDSVTRAAITTIRGDLVARGRPRSVVVAHTFVTGGAPSDSERDLSIGNVEYVALDAFAGIDYVALGHLHGPQAFADGRVAYSGSPLRYSFSEERHHKGIRVVELDAAGGLSIEKVPLEIGRPLRTLRGELARLLGDPSLADAEGARVRVVLTDDALPHQAMVRLRKRFPDTVELRHEPERPVTGTSAGTVASRRRELPPLELVESFWVDQSGARPSEAERQLFVTALAAGPEPT
jgi:exonuclease SbcD